MDFFAAIVSTLSLVATGIAAFLAYLTLRSNHKWNRRKAAQDATRSFNQKVKNRDLLKKHIDYVNSFDPVPFDELSRKFEEEPELKSAVHSLLNYFEMLARGVNQRVYDEKLISEAWKGAMTRAMVRFGPYIKRRRNQGSENAWRELESLVDEWKHQKTKVQKRLATG